MSSYTDVIIAFDPQAAFSDPALNHLADGPAKDLLRKLSVEYDGYADNPPTLVVKHAPERFETKARPA
jgi:hypothetical protein